jgi:hypothetical protein
MPQSDRSRELDGAGGARGDELPPELQTETGRREWLARELEREPREDDQPMSEENGLEEQAASEPMDGFDVERILARTQGRVGWLREARRQQDRERWQTAAPIPRSRPDRLRLAARWLEDDLAAEQRGNAAYEAFREHRRKHDPRRLGGTPKPYSPPQIPQGEVNITDPDSRRMMGNRRYIQSYNAQAVVNEQQIVIAAEITADAGDFSHLRPMLTAALSELEAAGIDQTPTNPGAGRARCWTAASQDEPWSCGTPNSNRSANGFAEAGSLARPLGLSQGVVRVWVRCGETPGGASYVHQSVSRALRNYGCRRSSSFIEVDMSGSWTYSRDRSRTSAHRARTSLGRFHG